MARLKPELVLLRLWQEQQGEAKVVMTQVEHGSEYKTYQAEITAPQYSGRLWYYFIIDHDGRRYFYGNNAARLGGEGQLYDTEPPSFQITVYKAGAATPNWFKEAVMYQIMPDRFFNDLPKERVLALKKGSVLHAHWDNTPFYIRDPDTGRIVAYDFFGGNLQGVIAKLPYLNDLALP